MPLTDEQRALGRRRLKRFLIALVCQLATARLARVLGVPSLLATGIGIAVAIVIVAPVLGQPKASKRP
ncbi:MAG TPA: hypothetical protein VGI10_04395 [Polyangiaceae bacterium]|jgi:hypothetical protein